MPPIKVLPIAEHWECSSCGRCCRGSLIHLDEHDLKKLREQHWERDPQFQDKSPIEREGRFSTAFRLRQRPDGSCVFLTDAGRCLIHERFGFEAKPLTCRMFPLQLVPRANGWILTTRRACPMAAADRGPKLETYGGLVDRLRKEATLPAPPATAPPLVPKGRRAEWEDFRGVAQRLDRICHDARFPIVRRLVHGLRFCSLLEDCRLRGLDAKSLGELTQLLGEAAHDVGDLFVDRQPPDGAVATLFRQSAAHALRLHPTFVASASWAARWRLARDAVAFARGKGNVPHGNADLPEVSFPDLEMPLGHLEEAVQRPLVRYFETHAATWQYALVNRTSWSLIESFRGLAFGFPLAMWLVRIVSHGRRPTSADMVDVVTVLDRAQGYRPLASRQHRTRIAMLARLGALEQLAAWYSR